MALLLPLVGFICGLLLASFTEIQYLKQVFASLLSRCFIPFVIVYNMVFYQAGSLSLMMFSFFVACIMFYVFLWIFKDQVKALCVSYVNLAWLGFPFALALFGPSISSAMVALYIGGSIFGNIWAVSALSKTEQEVSAVFKKVAWSPPVIALFIAVICRLMGLQHLTEHYILDVLYLIAKWGMTFTGMCVLGMWLRRTKVYWHDILQSAKVFLAKLFVGIVFCGLTYWLIPIPHIEQYIGVMFLIFLLPPAANIVALETHYRGTGISASYIASGTIVSCFLVLCYAAFLHSLAVLT